MHTHTPSLSLSLSTYVCVQGRLIGAAQKLDSTVKQCGSDVRAAWEQVAKRRQSETAGLVDEVVDLCNGSGSAFEKEFGISLSKIVMKKGEKSSGVTYNKAYNVTIVLNKMNALAEFLRLAASLTCPLPSFINSQWFQD
jgi:hypothetical protein